MKVNSDEYRDSLSRFFDQKHILEGTIINERNEEFGDHCGKVGLFAKKLRVEKKTIVLPFNAITKDADMAILIEGTAVPVWNHIKEDMAHFANFFIYFLLTRGKSMPSI